MAKKGRRFEPSFENLPIDQLIGAPLRATASANSMMAKEQAQFLMEYCFMKNGDSYFPVMIEMVMVRSRIDSDNSSAEEVKLRQYTTRFNLPLLTIIPINSLSVESFEIDFDMEITSSKTSERKKSTSMNGEKDQDVQETKLIGKVSNKVEEQRSNNSKYPKKINSKLSINIKGGQLPLPEGLTTLLEMYTKSIEPIEVNEYVQLDDSDEK